MFMFGQQQMAKEKDIELLEKDLANCKVQLEAKDAAYLQLLHKVEHYQKTAEELSLQLSNFEVEREVYVEECEEARVRVGELEAKVKEMADQVVETGKIKEQLLHVLCQLKAVQGEVLTMETELVAAREEKLKALIQVEIVENAAMVEKKRAEEFLKSISELNQAISLSRQASFDEESEKRRFLPGKEDQMRKDEKMVRELESLLLSKSVMVDSLQAELNQANELLRSSYEVVSDVTSDLNKLKEDVIDKKKENSDQAVYIRALEIDMEEIKERENEAQVEIALLKAELHKLRSILAAVEAQESEKESQILREEPDEADGKITISIEEYKSLTDQSERKDNNQLTEVEKEYEVEILRKELEAGMAKVAEFRTRAEQAVTRAEAAERAKLLLENQLGKWKEQKQRRKAALAALREESLSRKFSSSYDDTPRNCQPLGEVLNMKF